MKKLLYGVAGLILLVIVAALAVPFVVDPNQYKSEIAAQVKKATGRDLTIAGDISLSVLPSPRLTVDGVRLANMQGAATPDMVRLGSLAVLVRFVPLLSGDIEVASIELVEPALELEKGADGKVNWDILPKDTGESKSAAIDIRFDRVRIVNGAVTYRDAATGSLERVEKLNATLAAESLEGPFRLEGDLVASGIPLTLSANVGRIAAAEAPVSVRIGVAGTDAKVAADGNLRKLDTAPEATLKLSVSGGSLGRVVAALSGDPQPVAALDRPFALESAVSASEKAIDLADLSLDLGGAKLGGSGAVALGDRVRTKLSLKAGSLDVDRLLRPRDGSAKPRAKETNADASGAIAFPTGIDATVDLTVDTVLAMGGRVSNLRLGAELTDGRVRVTQLTARFPGDTTFEASATAEASGGKLVYGAKVDLRAANLRTLFDWLGVNAAGVAPDHLRRLTVAASLTGNSEQAQIKDVAIQLDATRMNGAVTIALARERPAFGASFTVDQVNVDAYFPPGPAKAKKPGAQTSTASGKSSDSPTAMLGEVDANVVLRLGTMTYQRTSMEDIRFDGTLVRNVLTIRNASVGNIAGTSAQVVGTLRGLEAVPTFKGSFAAASDDLTGLFRVAGLDVGVEPRRFGKMRLSSSTETTPSGMKFDASLQLAEVRAKLAGFVEGLTGGPQFELTLDAQHPEFSRFAALFGSGEAGSPMGRFAFKATAKGDLEKVNFQTDAGIAGGEFRISGSATHLAATPAFDAGFNFKHPNLSALITALSPESRPSNLKLGPLNVVASVKGDADDLAISALEGLIGPTQIKGTGSYKVVKPRPRLNLNVTAGIIPLSDFLPVPVSQRNQGAARGGASQGGGQAAAAGEHWSRKPFNMETFGAVDANIDIGAEALLYKNFRVDNPKIAATIKDKILNIAGIEGRMFGGAFRMTGQVNGNGTPVAVTSVKVDRANVGKALFQGAEYDISNGIMTYAMDLTARGNSQYEMVRTLAGNGKISVTDGVVTGFDLKRMNASLRNIGNLSGLPGLISAAMGGGTTHFSSLSGTFNIDKGIVRTDDLRLTADGGAGSASGYTDLPSWNMDMRANFRLTDIPRAPPFQMRAVGPPDDPRRFFDFNALQQWMVTQGIGGALIKDFLPGSKRDGSSGSNQPQPKAPSPADVLKGLLKGLKK